MYASPRNLAPWEGLTYVALGSSYASGPGIEPMNTARPPEAGQSLRNYPHLVAYDAGLELIDVSSGGATIDDLLINHQYEQPPQVTAITPETALVTVTIGGNDVGLTQYLMANSVPSWMRGFGKLDDAGDAGQVRTRINSMEERFATLIAAIRSALPTPRS